MFIDAAIAPLAGKNAKIQTIFGQTPLMKAAFANSHHIVLALVHKKANVDVQAKDGRTALMIAGTGVGRATERVCVYVCVCERETDRERESERLVPALIMVGTIGTTSVLVFVILSTRPLLLRWACVRACACAGQANNLKIVEYLRETGKADIDLQNDEGKSAIMLAAENGCYMVVTYLAKAGANTTLKDKAGTHATQPCNGFSFIYFVLRPKPSFR